MAFVFAGTRRRFHGVVGSILSRYVLIFRRPAGIIHPRKNVLSLFFCVRQYLCSDLLAECVSVWWHVRQTINGGERIPASFWSRLTCDHFFLEHFPLLLHGFGLPDLLLGLLELLVDVALAWSKGRASVACYGGGLAVRPSTASGRPTRGPTACKA